MPSTTVASMWLESTSPPTCPTPRLLRTSYRVGSIRRIRIWKLRGTDVLFSRFRQACTKFVGFAGDDAYDPEAWPTRIVYTISQNRPPLSSDGSHFCSR